MFKNLKDKFKSNFKNLKTVKGIIFFDIDDTLIQTTNFSTDAREKSFEKIIEFKKNLSKEILWKEYYKVHAEYGSNYQFHFDRIFENLNIKNPEKDKLVAIGVSEYHKHKINIKKYTFKNLKKKLKKLESNYILGIISIGIKKKQWEKLYLIDLIKIFKIENIYIEKDKSTIKNKKFYINIFNKYSIKYNCKNIFMIGDREDGDILPANQAGFKTIRVGSGEYNSDYNCTSATYKIKTISDILKILN